MTTSIDILHLFPDVASIGQKQLQTYCDEWLRRPIAREYGIAQVVVNELLLLYVSLGESERDLRGDKAFIPIDELLGYIIDRHFADDDQRRQLHASVRQTRQRWPELNRDYEVTVGRLSRLYLTCKNPTCQVPIETAQYAPEGRELICPPSDLTCPACGAVAQYDGSDLHFLDARK